MNHLQLQEIWHIETFTSRHVPVYINRIIYLTFCSDLPWAHEGADVMNAIRRGILLGMLVAGCGGPDYGTPVTVTGTVSLDGKPLPNMEITFHNVAGGLPATLRTVRGQTDAEGRYTLDEIYPAEYQVGVTPATEPTDSPVADESQVLAVPNAGPLQKYELGNSPLRASVSSEMHHFDFTLENRSANPAK